MPNGSMKINGLRVVDGKKEIKLNVKALDIKKAEPKVPGNCVAARTCKRQLGATEALVHVSRVYLRFNGKYERYQTTPALRSEIVAFDRGGTFEPGEYYLSTVDTREIRLRGKAHSKRPPKHVRPYKTKRKHFTTRVRPIGLYA